MTAPARDPSATGPTFRSGAVARMAQMPVATLRIWEQRHQAVQPATAASGHRLYGPADVQRVMLLRQLTERGHAIGSIATLSTVQLTHLLRQVSGLATAWAGAPPTGRQPRALHTGPLRLVVIGPALATRLQRPAVSASLGRDLQPVAVLDTPAEAALATTLPKADLLVWHVPALTPTQWADMPSALRAAQRACRADRIVVLYRYAGAAATRAFAALGAQVAPEPTEDEALGRWLAAQALPRPDAGGRTTPPAQRDVIATVAPLLATPAPGAPTNAAPPRRYDDTTLARLAGRPSSVACECPRHIAELLVQLASFETYSAGCQHRNDADAQLHAYLHQVAGAARSMFEAALERVVQHEGVDLR